MPFNALVSDALPWNNASASGWICVIWDSSARKMSLKMGVVVGTITREDRDVMTSGVGSLYQINLSVWWLVCSQKILSPQ